MSVTGLARQPACRDVFGVAAAKVAFPSPLLGVRAYNCLAVAALRAVPAEIDFPVPDHVFDGNARPARGAYSDIGSVHESLGLKRKGQDMRRKPG